MCLHINTSIVKKKNENEHNLKKTKSYLITWYDAHLKSKINDFSPYLYSYLFNFKMGNYYNKVTKLHKYCFACTLSRFNSIN